MKNKPILIVAGEPKSIFFEIFFKSLRKNKFKSPILLIASREILKKNMKKFNFKKKIKFLNYKTLNNSQIDNRTINLIDINLNKKKSNIYIKECFDIAFTILNSGLTKKFINGPIDKTKFLNKRYHGITEYISDKFKIKKNAMLIYNQNLSVCPVTTHIPLKIVSKKINKKIIEEKVLLINDFYKKNIGLEPKIAVTGLNPHCESVLDFNEDNKIILPVIEKLKKRGFKIFGPFPADTIFLKQNRKKYNVILGMYHDQVLSPIKTLQEYDAINITLGLPFLRVSPDHGPNKKMINKNLSSPTSLIKAMQFLDKR
tara:strand:+ start:3437 stop:4378 length:942 start_codon:yes stop_codon:yes gene_type:complete